MIPLDSKKITGRWNNRFILVAIVIGVILLSVSCGTNGNDSDSSQDSVGQDISDSTVPGNGGEAEPSDDGSSADSDEAESDDLLARIFAANDADAEEKAAQGKSLIYDPYGPDRDCDDFDQWGDANLFYLRRHSNDGDVHELDEDGDGIPCESLPGSP